MANWYELPNVTPEWIDAMKVTTDIAEKWTLWEWEVMREADKCHLVVRAQTAGGEKSTLTWGTTGKTLIRNTCYRIAESFSLPKREVLNLYKITGFQAARVDYTNDSGGTYFIDTTGRDKRFVGYWFEGRSKRVHASRLLYPIHGLLGLDDEISLEAINANPHVWATHVAIFEEVDEE